jgi:hypothetical protein
MDKTKYNRCFNYVWFIAFLIVGVALLDVTPSQSMGVLLIVLSLRTAIIQEIRDQTTHRRE